MNDVPPRNRSASLLARFARLIAAVVVFASGCAPREAEKTTAPSDDVVERMFQGRVAAMAFQPPGVRAQLAFLDSLADSTTALAVWVEVRADSEAMIAGAWGGDTTVVQVAGGTGLRGFAREGAPGAGLLALATAEAASFTRAPELAPPPAGKARLWMVTPSGTRVRELGARELFEADRRSSPLLQEARLFAGKSLGDVIEFEAGTAAKLESLGVVRGHTAAGLAAALGIDPQSLY